MIRVEGLVDIVPERPGLCPRTYRVWYRRSVCPAQKHNPRRGHCGDEEPAVCENPFDPTSSRRPGRPESNRLELPGFVILDSFTCSVNHPGGSGV